MATEMEIVRVMSVVDDGVYTVIAQLPGNPTQPFAQLLPADHVDCVGKAGRLSVEGARYGYPGPSVFLAVKPIEGAAVPVEGDRIRWA